MFENPRITPHELVQDNSLHEGDQVIDLDIDEYGEVYEPHGSYKVSQVKELRPSGHDSYEGNGKTDAHGEQPYYSRDASSGKQGAGK